ncbi:hypothetical protein K443DRAFT_683729 [Laccaria amethystina LaAM-08-1]|uniref:Uncharacterized protein n=1 Tax=Laccaria amethystina LaAM-08-1 TaxID=1095629 RepID=A0A0C9XE91_9AGAR|nr:hypothetical protein K443DRAFT_683729 [Laccaria amethystina LaAM-08-1]
MTAQILITSRLSGPSTRCRTQNSSEMEFSFLLAKKYRQSPLSLFGRGRIQGSPGSFVETSREFAKALFGNPVRTRLQSVALPKMKPSN